MSGPVDSASAWLAPALRALRARVPEILELTRELVAINSHSHNPAGLRAVAAQLERAVAGLALETRVERTAQGEHLVFSTARARTAPAILLVGHHDTVFPPGTFEGFQLEGDVARGPGVLDMKSGLALIIVALRALSDSGLLAELALRFVSVADEEIGSPGSTPLVAELAGSARAALVFEAGRTHDAIITSRRGSGYAVASAHGRAAHAGNALAEGRNAIWALARFVDHAQRLSHPERGYSLSVGVIRGGTSRNTVPDSAEAELDLRFADRAGQDELLHELAAAAERAAREVPGTRVALTHHISRRPWAGSSTSAALYAAYAQCQREAGLEARESGLVGGGSDANTTGSLGVPTLDGLGARGGGFHTREEHILVSSLGPKAEALLRFLVRDYASQRDLEERGQAVDAGEPGR